MSQEILESSLRDQIEALASSKISSAELTQKYIDRIRSFNPKFNIVIREDFERAMIRARELDATLLKTGKPVGALHGLPFTLKDAFRVKGMGTSFGLPGSQFLPAFSNCTIVERLLQAGAVLLGQTNVPLSCFDWQSNSPIYGLTKNPLDPSKTVGGSSGGSAASVAAHFSPFEIGSDIAGSIRYPAHCCGVFGLRPTHNFVPFDDVGPSLHPESFKNICVAGPLASSIADLKVPLAVMTGQAVPTVTVKKQLSIMYTEGWGDFQPDADSRQQLSDFIERLGKAGHTVVRAVPKIDFKRGDQLWGIIVGYEYNQSMPAPTRVQPALGIFNYFFNTRRLRAGAIKDTFEEGLFASKKKYESALAEAEKFRAEYDREMSAYDLWITPTAVSEAIPHQKTGTFQQLNGKRVAYGDYLGHYLMATSVLHHPILTAPLRSGAKFPISVQLHGKRGEDWELLELAELIGGEFAG